MTDLTVNHHHPLAQQLLDHQNNTTSGRSWFLAMSICCVHTCSTFPFDSSKQVAGCDKSDDTCTGVGGRKGRR